MFRKTWYVLLLILLIVILKSTASAETVSVPKTITGTSETLTGKEEIYTVGGAVSNTGHTVEYRFNWGDGIISEWGSAVQSHIWAASGLFNVKSQARCSADPEVISKWSTTLVRVKLSYVILNVSINPGSSGSVARNPDKAGYLYNETVELTAIANSGYSFNSWSGDITGSANPFTVIMETNKTISANFTAASETVSAPTIISGASTTIAGKSEVYIASGASSSLGHTMNYRFDWGDGKISEWGSASQSHSWTESGTFSIKSQSQCATDIANISSWSEYFVNVTVDYLTLNVSVTPSGAGTVVKYPDKAGYSYNESVRLTAAANAGYSFSNWNGDAAGSTNPLSISMNSNKTITANFTPPSENVSAPTNITGPATTIAGKSEIYTASGALSSLGHTLQYQFNWGDGTISDWGDATQSHTWSTAGTFNIRSQARCETDITNASRWSGNLTRVKVSYLTLNTTVIPVSSGNVVKNPDKTGYSYNESVQLTAVSNAGFIFGSWSGDATGSVNSLTITLTANMNVTANFTLLNETISIPTIISGPAATIAGKSETYTTNGAVSSLGHSVEYRFDWGDGNISGWGDAAQSHIWATNGTFAVKSQARCSTDITNVSLWSEIVSNITVSYLTLNIALNPEGSGSVSKNPDKEGYSFNEPVELTANGNTGYAFASWSGDETGSTNPLNLTMSTNKTITADFVEQSTTLQLTAISSMERVPRSGSVSGTAEVSIYAAKNEVESFQVAITSPGSAYQITDAVLTNLTDPYGNVIENTAFTLYRVDYVNITQLSSRPESGYTTGYYADPLIPFINPVTGQVINQSGGTAKYALPIDVSSQLNGAVWIDIKIPSNAAAGNYTGNFTVTCSDLSETSIPVTLTVWDFILPDGPTCLSNFGMYNNITSFYGPAKGTTAFNAIEHRYAEETARHRINPFVPYRFLPEGGGDGNLKTSPAQLDSLTSFITRNHVTSIRIPFESVSPGPLLVNYFANYSNYMADHGWIDGAYYWPIDEPNTSDAYNYITIHTSTVYTGSPRIPTMVTEQTYPQDPAWPDISNSVDIWCPVFEYIDEGTINQKLARGNRVWSYTALSPTTPGIHPQYDLLAGKHSAWWQIDRPLTNYRVPLWFNYRYHITGLLYYNTMTSSIPDPWTNPHNNSSSYNGDGMLFYPGTPCGFQGPVPSIRLKNLRDGMEDYDYMKILEIIRGYEAVMSYVNSVSPEWWIFSTDPSDFTQARKNMASDISGHQMMSPKILTKRSVDNISKEPKPKEYKVENPYPNPFNPITTISFALPIDSQVNLSVYSLTGQRLAVLKEGREKAGKYSVSWNAAGFSSGLYFFVLKANDYISTHKVLYVK
jgi:hypothetical protein